MKAKIMISFRLQFVGVIFVAMTGLLSCSIEGYTNDYNKLSASEKALVHQLTNFDSLHAGEVYAINPISLKKELSHHSKSLVSLYNVGCSSSSCKVVPSMSDMAKFAEDHDCQLFIIMTDYNPIRHCADRNISFPIYVIDDSFYGEKRRYKYERYFLNDLVGYPTHTKYENIPEEYQLSLLFVFEHDSLIGVMDDLSEDSFKDMISIEK